ncbi:MAG TPA: general stress protein [Ktedonobacteraceae bacterium]|jgi:hypothetical protein|nr:general stress protein [Ktedonobacteraceae bacterium]
MAIQRFTLVGIFRDRVTAENAVQELRDAGFTSNDISYSGGASRSFFDKLSSLFSSTNDTSREGSSGWVASDLMNMGLPEDEARYYARAHDDGHPIVVVHSTDRLQDALTVLHHNGAYRYDRRAGTAQPIDLSQAQRDTLLPHDQGPSVPDYSTPRDERARETYYNAPEQSQRQANTTPPISDSGPAGAAGANQANYPEQAGTNQPGYPGPAAQQGYRADPAKYNLSTGTSQAGGIGQGSEYRAQSYGAPPIDPMIAEQQRRRDQGYQQDNRPSV